MPTAVCLRRTVMSVVLSLSASAVMLTAALGAPAHAATTLDGTTDDGADAGDREVVAGRLGGRASRRAHGASQRLAGEGGPMA